MGKDVIDSHCYQVGPFTMTGEVGAKMVMPSKAGVLCYNVREWHLDRF
ncbi:MAG: hypothetical protein JWP91_409 [Fibrobacteres bacterium]|nr:hypothetical protein [Fibrobacterota bacterium]